jgi:NAD(P)-dependent dehydrogenase (short-subunit alcohol dehydrogenase family)
MPMGMSIIHLFKSLETGVCPISAAQDIKTYADLLIPGSKGFFNFAQATLPLLLESVETSPHPPSLIITGATASLRGSATMSAFASGKFALRATGQSLAREFGPKGIHIAHVIVDGVIDIPRTHDWPVNNGAPDGKISSDAVRFPRSFILED